MSIGAFATAVLAARAGWPPMAALPAALAVSPARRRDHRPGRRAAAGALRRGQHLAPHLARRTRCRRVPVALRRLAGLRRLLAARAEGPLRARARADRRRGRAALGLPRVERGASGCAPFGTAGRPRPCSESRATRFSSAPSSSPRPSPGSPARSRCSSPASPTRTRSARSPRSACSSRCCSAGRDTPPPAWSASPCSARSRSSPTCGARFRATRRRSSSRCSPRCSCSPCSGSAGRG